MRRSRRWLLALLVPALLGGGLFAYGSYFPLRPGLEGCGMVRTNDARFRCHLGEIRELVRDQGPAQAMAVVEREAANSSNLFSDCHLAFHEVGEPAGRRAAKAGKELDIDSAPGHCESGYVHGYFTGFLAQEPASGEAAGRVCAVKSDLENGYTQCVHAYGHHFARTSAKDPRAGATSCRQIRRQGPVDEVMASAARDECMYGMFMEYTLMDVRADRSGARNPCAEFDVQDDIGLACYRFLPGRVGMITEDWNATARACHDLAPSGEARNVCVTSYARGVESPQQCDLLPAAAERRLCHDRQGAPGQFEPLVPAGKDG